MKKILLVILVLLLIPACVLYFFDQTIGLIAFACVLLTIINFIVINKLK